MTSSLILLGPGPTQCLLLQVNGDTAVALEDVNKERDELEAATTQVGASNVRWIRHLKSLTLLATAL